MDKQEVLIAILAETRRQYDAAHDTLAYAAKEAVADLQQQLAEARDALAPSPGVDAAEQKPQEPICYLNPKILDDSGKVCTREIRSLTWSSTPQYGWTMPVYAAPSPAASADEWMAEAERLLRAYVAGRFAYIARPDAVWPEAEHAALLAHLKAHP